MQGKLEMNSKKDLYDPASQLPPPARWTHLNTPWPPPACCSTSLSTTSSAGFTSVVLWQQWRTNKVPNTQQAWSHWNSERGHFKSWRFLWIPENGVFVESFRGNVWSVLIGFHPIQTSLGFALLVLILKLDLWSGPSLPFVAQIFSWTNSKSWPGKLLFHQENKWLKSLSCLISGFKCSVIISLNWSNAVYKLKITEAGTLTTSRSYRSNTQKLLWETHCKKRDVRRWSFSWKYKATPPSLAHGNALLYAFFKEYPRTGLKFRLEQHFSPAFCFPAGAGSGAIWRKLETDHWSNS